MDLNLPRQPVIGGVERSRASYLSQEELFDAVIGDERVVFPWGLRGSSTNSLVLGRALSTAETERLHGALKSHVQTIHTAFKPGCLLWVTIELARKFWSEVKCRHMVLLLEGDDDSWRAVIGSRQQPPASSVRLTLSPRMTPAPGQFRFAGHDTTYFQLATARWLRKSDLQLAALGVGPAIHADDIDPLLATALTSAPRPS